jgi:Flp pilus assembly protein TadD
MYPHSSNVYDSLGEAYLKAEKKEMAIQNYMKSLELDPTNANAVNALNRLKLK